MSTIPRERIRVLRDEPAGGGKWVLYWMTANRRAAWSFSLDRALELAKETERPLVVLEALRVDYRWACERFHAFVLDGMRDNERAFEGAPVSYYPYVEPEVDAGKGLVERLARDAAAVVTDDFPCFFLRDLPDKTVDRIPCRFEAIDSNGLWPMRSTDKVFARAFDFRRFLQRELRPHLEERPSSRPLVNRKLPTLDALPDEITKRWPRATEDVLAGKTLADLPLDHDIGRAELVGGAEAGEERVKTFLDERLARYGERNAPEKEATSGLSPYLHFGHVSAHQVFAELADREEWTPEKLVDTTGGKREWWGMSEEAMGFLDELVTWREVGYNRCALTDDFDRFESLPDWAIETLDEHADDEREHVYDLEQFARADTHDELWNAAQNELRRSGVMHNYLRMLWGKKILHWSESPRVALDTMVELNNRYALDGRNPNSYSGIFWVLGRYDRPWGPERPVFGKIRYMTSDSTRRKFRTDAYVERWNGAPTGQLDFG